MPEKKVITISGKGGVGKTTFSTLLLRILVDLDKYDVLMIDADPDSNLPDTLEIPIDRTKTVGGMAFRLKKLVEKGSGPGGLPPNVSKKSVMEGYIYEVLQEQDGFDLIVMGRTEGEGCYCYPNNLMAEILDTISKNYDYTIMDMEAGLEHMSRRTARNVDIMFIVTDASQMGINTTKRIKEIGEEVTTKIGKQYIVGNRFSESSEPILQEKAKEFGMEVIGFIPLDDIIARYNLEGKSLLDIPPDTPALQAVKEIAKKAGIL
ncbi:MAG: nucleotide-binding protein [Candidatus Helarchaeota archaeon]